MKIQKLVKSDNSQKSITRVDSPVFERKPAVMAPIQVKNATASFFDMAGGNQDSPNESSSDREDSPVFAVRDKERKNSLLQVLIEESKERKGSFAEMAFQQLQLDDEAK